MRWESEVSRGEWIAERVAARWGDLHVAVPWGFEAYARVFHPVEADRPMGGTWAEVAATGTYWPGEIERRSATWRDVAEESGAVWHPLAQWQAIGRGLDVLDRIGLVGRSGWRYSNPGPGDPGVAAVAALARTLARHTSTPDSAVAAVWEGRGGLFDDGSLVVLTVASTAVGADEPGLEPAAPSEHHVGPPLGPEVADGPRLRLPWRDHVLFATDLAELSDTGWPRRAPWVRLAWSPDAPNLVWPDDRAWVVVSEIDWDSTIVAGSRAAIEAVLATPGIEALEIPPGADLSSNGDTVNP